MQIKQMLDIVITDLNDLKAINIISLDVRHVTQITDYMVIASGNSSKHVHAIADHLFTQMKNRHLTCLSIESDPDDEWVLVDLNDIVVHIMQQRTRDFYNLEKLWGDFNTLALKAIA